MVACKQVATLSDFLTVGLSHARNSNRDGTSSTDHVADVALPNSISSKFSNTVYSSMEWIGGMPSNGFPFGDAGTVMFPIPQCFRFRLFNARRSGRLISAALKPAGLIRLGQQNQGRAVSHGADVTASPRQHIDVKFLPRRLNAHRSTCDKYLNQFI